jgi:serine/threonine protein phosphatase PrpC
MISQAKDESGGRVELASRSHVGQVRTANEDSCDALERADRTRLLRLLVVADGMGGHQGGATASRTTVAAISEFFEQDTSNNIEEMIRGAIASANARVYELSQQDHELEGMGTTVVALVLEAHHRATIAHVGDSRAYRCRRGQIEALTSDHSVVAEMQRRGLISADEAAIHPRRNEILRSVGVLPEVEVEVTSVRVAPGDRFVLCSDGLTGVVSDDEIAAVVEAETPATAVDVLIQMANERGGPDNITVQVVSIPFNASEADPEATAPVELSEGGINAVENARLERKRRARIVSVMLALALCAGVYFFWQLIRPASTEPPSASAIVETLDSRGEPELAPGQGRGQTTHAPQVEDRFENEPDAPRRGIPR